MASTRNTEDGILLVRAIGIAKSNITGKSAELGAALCETNEHPAFLRASRPRNTQIQIEDYFISEAPLSPRKSGLGKQNLHRIEISKISKMGAEERNDGDRSDQILKKPDQAEIQNCPSYEAATADLSAITPRATSTGSHQSDKSSIMPLQDEGNEALPEYSCSIMMTGLFHMKMEYESAIYKATDRKWYKVFVELQGTALRFYKCKVPSMFLNGEMKASNKLKGELLKTYTLQHGDVGVATDYCKRTHVIRLRVETDQFLLSHFDLPVFISWLEFLTAAIDLSPPLDQRTLPKEYALPRRNRRRVPAVEDVTASLRLDDNALILQQRELFRREFPHLVEDSEAQQSDRTSCIASLPEITTNQTISTTAESTVTSNSTAMTTQLATPRSTTSTQALRPLMRVRFSRSASTSTATSTSPTLSPTQSSSSTSSTTLSSSSSRTSQPSAISAPYSTSSQTHKWSPQREWTAAIDLLYAKRSMAVLLKKSPRKSNFLIMHGREWLIDWETGKAQRCGPPEYCRSSGLAGEGSKGYWILARGGMIVRKDL